MGNNKGDGDALEAVTDFPSNKGDVEKVGEIEIRPLEAALCTREVLEGILKKLIPLELLRLRRVSKLWNDEAVRILLYYRLFRRNDGLKRFQICLNSSPSAEASAYALESIYNLHQLSKYPSLLFKNLTITTCGRNSDLSQNFILSSTRSKMRKLLDTFGPYVIQVRLNSCENNLNILSNFLTLIRPKSFLPNVKTLCVSYDMMNFIPYIPPPALPLIEFQGDLELLNLSFRISSTFPIQDRTKIFHSIIKSSPKLNQIILNDDTTAPFMKVLKSLPAVGTNLKMLHIQGDILITLKSLSEIKFSQNLQALKLNQTMFRALNTKELQEEKEGWMAFSKRVGSSLISLEVCDRIREKGQKRRDCMFLQGLEMMPALKKLNLNTADGPSDQNYDFLKKLPTLQVLRVRYINSWTKFVEKYCDQGSSGDASFSKDSTLDFCHNFLEEIHLLGREYPSISDCKSVELLCAIFPRLTNLSVKILKQIKGTELVRFFEETSKMKNLKVLDIHMNFHCRLGDEGMNCFINGLERLNDSSSLERLQLTGLRQADLESFPFEKLLILQGSQLRQVDIIHFKFGIVRTMEFFKTKITFAQRNVSFDLKQGHGSVWLRSVREESEDFNYV